MKNRAAITKLAAEICAGKPGADKALDQLARHADEPAVAWRLAAVAFGGAGRYDFAAKAQHKAIDAVGGMTDASPHDRMYLADLFRHAGRTDTSRTVVTDLLADHPDFLPARLTFASLASMTKDFAEAARRYRAILADHPDNVFALDGLARAAGWIGAHDEARKAGGKSLTLKDRIVSASDPHWQISDKGALPYDPSKPERNIIAYSLWGSDARYLDTLTGNVDVTRDLFPAWQCRIYCDRTVPSGAMTQLRSLGAQIVLMPTPPVRHASLLWRFLAADDPGIDRVLFRDADAKLTVRERVAVDDWLASDKAFHLMRDWWSHTDLMLAGMWGAVGGQLTGIKSLMEAHVAKVSVPNRQIDQQFLASLVWPSIRNHTLIHDDLFGVLGARPFPPFGRLPEGQHVGMNVSAASPRTRMITPRLTIRKPAGESA